MKTIFLIMTFSLSVALSKVEDPFMEEDRHIENNIEYKNSKEKILQNSTTLLSDDLLAAFDEKRMDPQSSFEENPYYRFFVNISGRFPILIKYYPGSEENKNTRLEIKKIERKSIEEEFYENVSHKKIEVSKNQFELIQNVLREVDMFTLPRADWLPEKLDILDADIWVYEFPSPNTEYYFVFSRKIPTVIHSNNIYEYSGIDMRRLSRENFLTSLIFSFLMIAEE